MPDDKTIPNIVEKSISSAEVSRTQEVRTESGANFESAEKSHIEERERRQVLEEISHAESAGPAAATPVLIAQQQFQQRGKKIENILEENMEEMFLSLNPDQQRQFKLAGERTAQEVNQLLESAKLNIKKIISLIKQWLAVIPGINKFFLEQEAKIKADEIIKLKR